MYPIEAKILLQGIADIDSCAKISSVVTDNRLVTSGSIFVCIKGERVDGHSFAAAAIDSKAEFVLCEYLPTGADARKCIIVPNTLDALITMSGNYTAQFSPVVVGVTGSVGKTTTKEFCYSIFSAAGKTIKTKGNQNNEIGMPNTLFNIDKDTKYAVVEMGMQGLGEISKLTRAARPMGAIITCIGRSHLLQLGSRENILKAKLEICEGLPDGAPLVMSADDDYLPSADIPKRLKPVYFSAVGNAEVQANSIAVKNDTTSFTICDRIYGMHKVTIPALGMHNVANALAAYTLATRLGIKPNIAAKALESFVTVGQRQKITDFHGITVIEDCYNANPDSMRAALNTLRDYNAMHRVAVLGDMLELGDTSREEHEQVGRLAAECDVNYLITVGEEARYIYARADGFGVTVVHCKDNKDAISLLKHYAREGDAILIKASHGMHFEDIIKGFYEPTDEGALE
ncbi:MAG: UDP-N-acetylmuramoyl-tripeptide--D-alanyl-D-alanine ligase [Oscillospiraceae bacterium]